MESEDVHLEICKGLRNHLSNPVFKEDKLFKLSVMAYGTSPLDPLDSMDDACGLSHIDGIPILRLCCKHLVRLELEMNLDFVNLRSRMCIGQAVDQKQRC
jgi:hypothetical protein